MTFLFIRIIYGDRSIDRFANHQNTKLERFNLKFYVPKTEEIHAFVQEWREENNLFIPPVKEILATKNSLW